MDCGRAACLTVVTDADLIEPGTLAIYGSFGKKPKEGAEQKSEGTMLRYTALEKSTDRTERCEDIRPPGLLLAGTTLVFLKQDLFPL